MKRKGFWMVLGFIGCFLLGVGLYFVVHQRSGQSEDQGSEKLEMTSGQVRRSESEKREEPPVTEIPKEIVQTQDSLYTYEQMVKDLETMELCFPGQIQVKELGVTADGRSIKEAVLGDEKAERHLMIQASIHGREYMNTQVAMRQLELFLRNYEIGSYRNMTYEELLQGLCVHVIPMANPDGVTISQYGPKGIHDKECRQILKQCREADGADGRDYWKNWKANARGVDLNRNFDVGWQEFQGSLRPSSERYKGDVPASETETQAILSIPQRYPVVGCMAYHSSGNLVYWDYGSRGQVYLEDQKLAQTVSEITGYEAHSTVSDVTDSAGCSDYFVLKLGIAAITVENGTGDCPLDSEEFPVIMEKNEKLLPGYLWIYQSGR